MRNRWGVLAVLFTVRLTVAFQFQSVAAVAPLLGREFRLGLADIGLLIGLYFTPGVAIALPGGAVGKKFGDRNTVLLALAVTRLFPKVKSNALEPGWVPTRMGGAGAPDDIDKAHRTQVWLATSDEPAAMVSGQYFFHQRRRDPDPATSDIERQNLLIALCRKVSGIGLGDPAARD